MYIYIKKHYYILEGPNKVHYYCFPLATYKAVLYKRSTVNPPPFMKVTVFDPFFKKAYSAGSFFKALRCSHYSQTNLIHLEE